jgi:hypothetical protein
VCWQIDQYRTRTHRQCEKLFNPFSRGVLAISNYPLLPFAACVYCIVYGYIYDDIVGGGEGEDEKGGWQNLARQQSAGIFVAFARK